MAFVWVQIWAPPSPFNEVVMGDASSALQTGRLPGMAHSSRQESSQPSPTDLHEDSGEGRKEQQANSPEINYNHSQQYLQQHWPPQTKADAFNMNQLSTALPDPSYQNYGQLPPQRYASGAGLVYQLPHVPQFAAPQSTANSSYNVPYQGQYQGVYASGNSSSPTHPPSGSSVVNTQFYHHQGFIGHQQQNSPYLMQPSYFNPQSQMYPAGPSAVPFVSRNSFSGESRYHSQQRTNEYLGINYNGGNGRPSSIS
jgi:hypothetical protein